MTSYNEYKYFRQLFEIEKILEIILSKHVKNIIFQYRGNDNSILYLDNNEVKCRIKIENQSLKFNMYNKKLDKWSNGDIYFSFNFGTTTNVGIGTNIGANIGINSMIQ